ncbi:amine oxidase [Actinoplanes sp. N902-109]|nr:amine oxidase [Actinoplanes sp. N902-109]
MVGAGVAGLACARELSAGGAGVRVVERGRVVGGRLASRRFDGRYADLGAAYFVADDPAFQELAGQWQQRGLARPWTDTFRVVPGEPASGPMRWAAPGGLRSLAEDLAQGLDISLRTELTSLPPGTTTVLAMPGPQAVRLGLPAALDRAARAQTWEPVIAVVLTYGERGWPDFHGAFVNDHPVLATVCDDGDRRGDGAPVLVAHTTPAFARQHLDDPQRAAPAVAEAVGTLFGLTEAPRTHAHRWTFAQPRPQDGQFVQEGGIFLAGDVFGKPRVQTAWQSGRAVARAILGQSTER